MPSKITFFLKGIVSFLIFLENKDPTSTTNLPLWKGLVETAENTVRPYVGHIIYIELELVTNLGTFSYLYSILVFLTLSTLHLAPPVRLPQHENRIIRNVREYRDAPSNGADVPFEDGYERSERLGNICCHLIPSDNLHT